ncbi:MAG: acetyl-CoA carboxylase biotin carboxyl carrier protein [Phycisphaerales bacterium]|nr:MAG: acetyl-CoA carboxylase biotin carboxyl carrier protein [Phycisphaerales bacterium]
MAEKDKDLRKIKELIEIMECHELAEIEIKHGDDKICLKRCSTEQPTVTAVPMISPDPGVVASVSKQQNVQSTPSSQATAQPEEDLAEIKSPMVGTFYATPSPESEPYVEPGSHVDSQTVVCIVEAMKVMNEIKAETGGTITEVLVTNGQAVEYGQVLFRVRPD